MKRFIIIIFSILFLCGCSNNVYNEEKINNIVKDKEYVIIDVRTKEEYDTGHIVDSINIPVDTITLENIEEYKDKIIFVYCKSGNRSNIASAYLKDLGLNVYDMGAYANIELPKENSYK